MIINKTLTFFDKFLTSNATSNTQITKPNNKDITSLHTLASGRVLIGTGNGVWYSDNNCQTYNEATLILGGTTVDTTELEPPNDAIYTITSLTSCKETFYDNETYESYVKEIVYAICNLSGSNVTSMSILIRSEDEGQTWSDIWTQGLFTAESSIRNVSAVKAFNVQTSQSGDFIPFVLYVTNNKVLNIKSTLGSNTISIPQNITFSSGNKLNVLGWLPNPYWTYNILSAAPDSSYPVVKIRRIDYLAACNNKAQGIFKFSELNSGTVLASKSDNNFGEGYNSRFSDIFTSANLYGDVDYTFALGNGKLYSITSEARTDSEMSSVRLATVGSGASVESGKILELAKDQLIVVSNTGIYTVEPERNANNIVNSANVRALLEFEEATFITAACLTADGSVLYSTGTDFYKFAVNDTLTMYTSTPVTKNQVKQYVQAFKAYVQSLKQ